MGTSLVHLGATLPWMALLTGDNTAAVASGLQRTGGLITSLALVLLVPASKVSADLHSANRPQS
jgi:hypothetical protein